MRGQRGRTSKTGRGAKKNRPDIAPKTSKASRVVRQTTQASPQKDSNARLSASELARLKVHFRFLKEHRKLLKLKLNAQEDLLLNGTKDPDTWGVVNHLFSKLEYARIAAAAERTADKDRPAFIARFLNFKPTLPLLLLYLEALELANHRGAADALSEALSVIDFQEVTEGQLRRVLDLIGEIITPSEQAPLLLQLLESRSFRQAIDGTIEKLPESLRQMVSPMRAVSSVVFHGKKNPMAATHLQRGIELLLAAQTRPMERAPASAIVRLVEHATELATLSKAPVRRQIEFLILKVTDASRRSGLQIRYARALMRASVFSAATEAVDTLAAEAQDKASTEAAQDASKTAERRNPKGGPNAKTKASTFALWSRALRAPRQHGIALLRSGLHLPTKSELPLMPGFCLQTQRAVWVRRFEKDCSSEAKERALTCAQRHRAGAPGLVPEYYRSGDAPGDFVCYLAGDTNLSRLAPDTSLNEIAAIARQLLSILKGLGQLGLGYSALPVRSFEVSRGRVHLLESWDARPLAAEEVDSNAVAVVKDWLHSSASTHPSLGARLYLNETWNSVQTPSQLLLAITELERMPTSRSTAAGTAP